MDPESEIRPPNEAAAGAAAEVPLVLDARASARLTGISRSTFLKLFAAGRTPRPIRLGRAVRWLREELVEWMRAGAPSLEEWNRIREEKRS